MKFCDKCGGPCKEKEDVHNLPNDPYAYFLVVKKYICTWCGREYINNVNWS